MDAKTDEISAEVALTPKSGSAAAKNFAALGSKTSLPAGVVAATNPAARMNVKVAVTDGMKKEYAATIDALFDVFIKSAGDQGEAIAKQVVDAIGPTLKAGELDAAGSLLGPDAKGHYQIIGAFAVKDGKEIEKLIKDLVKQFGPLIEQAVTIKFDVEKIGEFNLHQIEIQQADEKFEKLFGTKTTLARHIGQVHRAEYRTGRRDHPQGAESEGGAGPSGVGRTRVRKTATAHSARPETGRTEVTLERRLRRWHTDWQRHCRVQRRGRRETHCAAEGEGQSDSSRSPDSIC